MSVASTKNIRDPLLGTQNYSDISGPPIDNSQYGNPNKSNLSITRKSEQITRIEERDEIEVPNNSGKSIDFNSHLEAFKLRTEYDLPFTLTQTEDAMFLEEDSVVTLEYHYFQNDCAYKKMNVMPEFFNDKGVLMDQSTKQPVKHFLGTQDYQKDSEHPMNAFNKNHLINYQEPEFDLRSQEQDRYMIANANPKDVSSENNIYHVQAVICKYTTSTTGGLQKVTEKDVVMGQRKFQKSEKGNMVLTRSHDLKVVSLVNFDPQNKNGEYFKIAAWTCGLQPVDLNNNINYGLSNYYKNIHENFDELIEVSFVGNRSYVMMIYMEKRDRTMQEQLDYETELQLQAEAENLNSSFTSKKFNAYDKRKQPRKARKYVFFNAMTGEVVFEYGGVQSPLKAVNNQKKQIEAYEIGVLVKETAEELFNPELIFFFCGDFMDQQIKDIQIMYKWAVGHLHVDLNELFLMPTINDKVEFVHEGIKNYILTQTIKDIQYYPFSEGWITNQKNSWETSITVCSNRTFTQFGFLNAPLDPSGKNGCYYYLHGPQFASAMDIKVIQSQDYMLDTPYYVKLPDDAKISHSRNSYVKDELYYELLRGQDVKTYIVRQDTGMQMKVKSPKITVTQIQAQTDVRLHEIPNNHDDMTLDVFQTIHINKGDQFAIFQTRYPKNANSATNQNMIEYENVRRETRLFNQQISDLPCIAYNLGDQRVCLINTLQTDTKKKYIIQLDPNEQFICFVHFNQFEDIGFYPKGLRIECCSHFAYLTRGRKSDNTFTDNRMNLLLIDPFNVDTQIAHFKSSNYFDDGIFQCRDVIIKTLIQSTMGKKRDMSFKTYLWTQFPNEVVRSRFLQPAKSRLVEVQDSDNEDPLEIVDDEDDDTIGKTRLGQVPMLMNNKDFMYYITKKNGMCYIMEGNPRGPYLNMHKAIWSIKSEKCLAFSLQDGDLFYFMDESFNVYKLARNENDRQLNIIAELTFKEMQTLDYLPHPFEQVTMNDKYILQGNKIFYLYDIENDEPFDEGIFEAEDLLPEDRNKPKQTLTKGPIMIANSTRFFNIYQEEKFKSTLRSFQLPDSTTKTLINDFLNWVDFSTFLSDGKILIKIRRRFMVFTSNGQFLDEAEFNNAGLDEHLKSEILPENTLNSFRQKPDSPAKKTKSGMKIKRKRDQILDFFGKPYIYAEKDPPPPLSQSNKMEFLQVSYSNQYFLFLDRMLQKILVYKLQEEGKDFFVDDIADAQKSPFQFVLQYDIQFDNSALFQHMYSVKVDPIKYYCNNLSQIKINDIGKVKMVYVEYLPQKDENASTVDCRIVGSIFSRDGETLCSQIESFHHVFEFPKDSSEKLDNIFEYKKTQVEKKIKQIWMIQKRLPKEYFDYTEYENLIEDLQALDKKDPDIVCSRIYYENLVVVYCGQYLKYGFLEKNPKKRSKKDGTFYELQLKQVENEKKGVVFKDAIINFTQDVEIIKLVETQNRNWLQIIAKDYKNSILKIITWDFNLNMEQSALQQETNKENCKHLVKGMNYKMNYFIQENDITDLEYNIPLRQFENESLKNTGVSYTKQVAMITEYNNQRKLHQDQAKYLGVERAHVLHYPLCRMDIVIWQNINHLHEHPDLVTRSCSLKNINLVFDGVSLFHYFADNPEMIEAIHQKFCLRRDNEGLFGMDKTLALQILNPDNNGDTALKISVQSQAPKSFECMIDMLKDYPDFCITKMMMKSLATILKHNSQDVIDFLDTCIYQPPQMKLEQFVPWDSANEEVLFACHTSYISMELLYQKLRECGVQIPQGASSGGGGGQSKEWQKDAEERKLVKSSLKDFVLEEDEEEEALGLMKVQIEAIDFDWIFYGENAERLIGMLAEDASDAVFTKKSIRMFISIMWENYQGAIIKNIFLPYTLYLCLLSYLAAGLIGDFIVDFDDSGKQDAEEETQRLLRKIKAYACVSMATILMICFGSLEVGAMVSDGLGYFGDVWNCIDATSLTLNTTFLASLTTDFVMEDRIMSLEFIYTVGGFACFFMWIKVFYWMRLFSALAYYVKLIQQTFADSFNFMLMVFIIINAFANYYYVTSKNMEIHSKAVYYDNYTNIPKLDVLISVYMLGALGDFDSTIYREGYDKYAASIMFYLATFVIAVVFMNMLIAIMGETFGSVTEQAEQSGLKEQVVLINDHVWLLDLQRIFKGQKYIIKMSPSSSVTDDSKDQQEVKREQRIEEAETLLQKKIHRLQTFLRKRMEGYDLNTRFLLKHSQNQLEHTIRKIKNLQKIFKQAFTKTTKKEKTALNTKSCVHNDAVMEVQLRRQKRDFVLQSLDAINLDQSDEITFALINQVCINWILLVEADGTREIGFPDFQEFMAGIQGGQYAGNQDFLEALFNKYDDRQCGMLKVEQFSNAVYERITTAMGSSRDPPRVDEDEIEQAASQQSPAGRRRPSSKYESGKKKKRKNVFAS